MPKVSIILPVFNGEEYIQCSIESVLSQTFKNWELIIIDDCSSDDTYEICKKYSDENERIRLIRNFKNMKLPATLNVGFREAIGDYLTWTSDDNIYDNEAIERMYKYMVDNPCVGMVYSNMYYIDEHGITIGKSCFEGKNLYMENCIGACFLYKKEVYEDVGEYDEELFLVEDYDYWIRISQQYEIEFLSGFYYSYRIHNSSLTKERTKDVRTALLWLRLKYFNYILQQLNCDDTERLLSEMYLTNPIYMKEKIDEKYGQTWPQKIARFNTASLSNNRMTYAIYGCGYYGRIALEYFGKDNVICFIDSNKGLDGSSIDGKKVLSLFEFKQQFLDCQIIIAADINNTISIADDLDSEGYNNYYPFVSLI